MLLRASGANHNRDYDLEAVMRPGSSAGVAHEQVLRELVEAAMGDDEQRCRQAREAVVAALGADALIDTAAVIAMFNQADRVADGAGIPLDDPLEMMTRDIRTELGVRRFASAANSPNA